MLRFLLLIGFVPAILPGVSLRFNTYLGGSGTDVAYAIARDASGNLVVAGTTSSADFPATKGAYQTSLGPYNYAGFIARLDPTGSKVLSATLVSSDDDTLVTSMALDAAGNVVVAGYTAANGFVSKFSPALDKLLFTNTLPNLPDALALDPAGNIYLTGITPNEDAFVTKLSPDGFTVIYTRTLGGSDIDTGRGIAVDAAGNVAVVGDTASANFPLLNPADGRFGGVVRTFGSPDQGDAFAARYDASGTLVFSTYLGGTGVDIAYAVAIDAAGNTLVGGYTESTSPSGDGFVSKISPAGALLWTKTLAGSAMDSVSALAVDGGGNVYAAGSTGSADFPVTADGIPSCRTGTGPFVATLGAADGALIRSSKGPGLGFDIPNAIAIDAAGGIYLAGSAASRVFFATPGAEQTAFAGGNSDAFAMALNWNDALGTYVACVLNAASYQPGNQAFFPTGAVAPNEFVSIFGAGLSAAAVTFDGRPATVTYSGVNQINAIVPIGVGSASTVMTAGSATPVSMPVNSAVPGIFTYAGGIDQGVVINDDDGTLNSVANPAARGSYITFYAAGAGIQNLPVTATIRGVPATVQYAGPAPGFLSALWQINVLVPADIDLGNSLPLAIAVGPYGSQLGVTLAVK